MNTKTKNKIEFLQKYLRKKYLNWHKIHPLNIVGFRIDKKVSKGKKERNYSVIFQVKKKKKEKNLDSKEIIPPFFKIRFPDGKVRKIKTDVDETGKPEFQLAECRKPKNNGKLEIGTAGVILTDNNNHFALTNYHVAGTDLMLNGQFFFQGADNNIFVGGQQATFEEGILSEEIDVAFIRLSNVPVNPNILGDGSQILGFIDGPLSPTLTGKEIKIYSKRVTQGVSATISTNSAVFVTGFGDFVMTDLLQIKPRVTKKGDSGGAVILGNFAVIGIIVGADQSFTYAVPFFKINNFKPLTIA